MKSKKAMSAMFKLAVVVGVVLILILSLGALLIKFGKGGVDVLDYGSGQTAPTEAPKGPVMPDRLTMIKAEAVGSTITVYPYSSDKTGDFDSSTCDAGLCALVLYFDREIKDFSNSYFSVEEFVPQTFGPGYWQAPTQKIESFVRDGNKKIVQISGFEKGKRYFVRVFTFTDYTELNTNKAFKLNSATSVLKFEIS